MPKQDRNRITVIQKLYDILISKFFLSTKCLTLDNVALALFNLTGTYQFFDPSLSSHQS